MDPAGRAARARAAGYVVRPLERDDIDEMSRVHVAVWREAYAGLMRPEALAALDPVASAEQRRARFDAGGLRGTVVALDPEGRLVGMASSGPSRDADAPVAVELYAINVLAAHHGSGLADLLVEATIGGSAASLWVVDGNDRAVAFYERLGFAPDGATKHDDDLGVAEVRYVRSARR